MILFVNGCVRENSRTLQLAKAVLNQEKDEICEVRLYPDGPRGLTEADLEKRQALLAKKAYGDPLLRWAKQFAEADAVVIAAPYWDLMFPAGVRAYLEAVMVCGLTFRYSELGIPEGLCRAKRMTYVTTAGGPIVRNFGYEYVEALARTFLGIPEVALVKAEGLDIRGADPSAIMEAAIREITE